jgi:hypothetical protein
MMPVQPRRIISDRILHPDCTLDPLTRLVAAAIVARINGRNDPCFASTADIAERTGISRRKVRGATAELSSGPCPCFVRWKPKGSKVYWYRVAVEWADSPARGAAKSPAGDADSPAPGAAKSPAGNADSPAPGAAKSESPARGAGESGLTPRNAESPARGATSPARGAGTSRHVVPPNPRFLIQDTQREISCNRSGKATGPDPDPDPDPQVGKRTDSGASTGSSDAINRIASASASDPDPDPQVGRESAAVVGWVGPENPQRVEQFISELNSEKRAKRPRDEGVSERRRREQLRLLRESMQ